MTKKRLNRGQGLMSEPERNHLLEIGALKEVGDEDVIACDSWCVIARKNYEQTSIFEGTKEECESELKILSFQRQTAKFQLVSYPKSYIEYMKKKKATDYAREDEKRAVEQIN